MTYLIKRIYRISFFLLFLFLISLPEITFSNGLTSENSSVVTLTVTGNTQQEAENSLRSTLNLAKTSTEDVLIVFDAGINEILIDTVLDVYSRHGKSISIDGSINGDTTNRIILKYEAGGIANRNWVFRVRAHNSTFKHLEIDASSIAAATVIDLADSFSVRNCVLRNSKDYALGFLGKNGFAENTSILGCKIRGILVTADNFVLGNNNVIVGTNFSHSSSAGIEIRSSAMNTTLGLNTNDYSKYNYVGGFPVGVKSQAPCVITDMVLGGELPNQDYCNSQGVSSFNSRGISFERVSGNGPVVIGRPGINLSVISTNASITHLYLLECDDVSVNNVSVGWSPFWCNDEFPSQEKVASHGIRSNLCNRLLIGNLQGNIVENLSYSGIALTNSSNCKISNNKISVKNHSSYQMVERSLNLYSNNRLIVENNEIGHSADFGCFSQGDSDIQILKNYIGVSKTSETLYQTEIGIKALGSQLLIKDNFFSSNLSDVLLGSCRNTLVQSNTFDAYSTLNPINTRPENKKCLSVSGRFQEIELWNNLFIGKNLNAIKSENQQGSWTDDNGVFHELSSVKIHGNKILYSTNSAIVISSNVDAEIGSETNPALGNEIINALIGINSGVYGNNPKSRRLLISNNYIGVSRSGEQGRIGRTGVTIANTDNVRTHLISSNVIANTGQEGNVHLDDGISLWNCNLVQMSKNRIFNYSGKAIKLDNSNLVNGSVIESPVFTGSILNQTNYHLKNVVGYATYPNAKVEIFRQKIGETGLSNYLGHTYADENGNWNFEYNLYNHIGFNSFFVTVTHDNETSEPSEAINFCVSRDEQEANCSFLPPPISFLNVSPGELTPLATTMDQGKLGIVLNDDNLEIEQARVYDFERKEVELFTFAKYSDDKYLLELSENNNGISGTESVYMLEIIDNKKRVTKIRFKN